MGCNVASPQPDKFTKISNELIENGFCRKRIPGESWQVLWAIIRLTYGYGKKMETISQQAISDMTGLKRQNVNRALKYLTRCKTVIKDDDSYVSKYGLNKNYEEWKLESKAMTETVINNNGKLDSKLMTLSDAPDKTGIKSDDRSVIKTDDKTVINSDAHKRNKDKKYIYNQLFDFWNNMNIRVHKNYPPPKNQKTLFEKAVDNLKKNGATAETIKNAIQNYANIYHGKSYYFKYAWTLTEFLCRGYENFSDWDICSKNYLISPNTNQKSRSPNVPGEGLVY
jgi:phage replication O-like protein O